MSEERECPYCGEFIKKVAKKCRHCGEFLDRKGRAPRKRGARMAGENVAVPLNGKIDTAGCAMCGTERAQTTSKKFQWTPSWIWITIIINLLVVIILSAIMTKRSSITLKLCQACKSAWTTASVVFYSFTLIGLFALPALIGVIGHQVDRRSGGVMGGLAGFVLWLVGVIVIQVAYKNKKQAVCKKIDDRQVLLKFPNPSQVERLMKQAREADD